MAMASAGMIEGITAMAAKKKRPNTKEKTGCNVQSVSQNADEYVSASECDADLTGGSSFVQLLIEKWQPQANQEEAQMNAHNSAVGKKVIFLKIYIHYIFKLRLEVNLLKSFF